MAPYLLPELEKRYGSVNVLKKESLYFTVSTPRYVFKDALLFSSPCSLSKYLKQNSVAERKSIFPYTYFHTIEDLDKCEDFPSHADFYSELKRSNVPESEYNEARDEFYRRKNLPESHPDHLSSMRGWLKYYNELDTVPLAHAIDNSFRNFFKIFAIDPSFCVSLPRFAQQCMFRSYDENEPLCYSFFKKESELRQLTRENLTGGLVNVFHRCIDLSGRPEMPHASQFAPNGKKFSSLMFYDFNSLYLYAQLLPFPATPGIILILYFRDPRG